MPRKKGKVLINLSTDYYVFNRIHPGCSKRAPSIAKNAPHTIPKLKKLLAEIAEHPRIGTGQAERLKHFEEETWSRRITKEHRLVYRIYDEVIKVLVVGVYGHYK